MSDTASQMVWRLAGRPSVEGGDDVGVECAMCGRDAQITFAARKALGTNYTDHYEMARRDSDRVCDTCVWACSGKPPNTLRMWSVLARPDRPVPTSHPKAPCGSEHLYLTARNDMRAIVNTLADPPDGVWLVSIAESGQKHHVPYAAVNTGRGQWCVRMDGLDVTATPADFRRVFSQVVALRHAGFAADEIETLAPIRHKFTPDTLQLWRECAAVLRPWRAGALMHLCCFLPNKDHIDEYCRTYPTGSVGPRPADRVGIQTDQRDLGRSGPGHARQNVLDSGTDSATHGSVRDTLF